LFAQIVPRTSYRITPVKTEFAKLLKTSFVNKTHTVFSLSYELNKVNELVVLWVEVTSTEYVQLVLAGMADDKLTDEVELASAGHETPDKSMGGVCTVRGGGSESMKLAPIKASELGLYNLIIICVVTPDMAGLPGKLLEIIGSAQMNTVVVVEFIPALIEVAVT
jgi:hypothetical protein